MKFKMLRQVLLTIVLVTSPITVGAHLIATKLDTIATVEVCT